VVGLVGRVSIAPTLPRAALAALLFNATIWGLSWWPLRELARLGLNGLWATAIVFLIGSVSLIAIWPGALTQLVRSRPMWLLALAAGLTNTCFNWGMTVGEVLRVVLLFYLMPVWSMFFARWLTGEPITTGAILRALLAIAGAAAVLWRPGLGLPWPAGLGDWLGVAGGVSFAFLNVWLRRMGETAAAARALAMSVGSAAVPALVASVLATVGLLETPPPLHVDWMIGAAALAAVLLIANGALQYGAPRLPSRVTAIVMLVEVPVAAVSSVLIGGESLSPQLIAGGALIIFASALAACSIRPQRAPREHSGLS
jgi:drug/metabolite transporter (DMT)-like permease